MGLLCYTSFNISSLKKSNADDITYCRLKGVRVGWQHSDVEGMMNHRPLSIAISSIILRV